MIAPQPDHIETSLTTGKLLGLVGLAETDLFEAKGSAGYDLDTPEGRYELARDVSAFANANGGMLILGLVTTRTEEENVDKVSRLELVAKDHLPVEKIGGVLSEYVHPRMTGLDIRWVADTDSPEEGVIVVRIPRQAEQARPFLVAKVVEDGRHQKAVVFGYSIRRGSTAIPFGVSELQRLLKDGISPTAVRLTSIEEKLGRLLENSEALREDQSAEGARDMVLQRISDILSRQ